MDSGSGLVEIWIPDGGFEIQRRKVKTPEGGTVVANCLVPKWAGDDLTLDRPLHRQPCLQRMLADCGHDQIVRLASLYALLTVTNPRKPSPGETLRADGLSPEPLDIWSREARALRAATVMWDSGRDRELVAGRITERLARAPFHLLAIANDGGIAIAYQPTLLIDAIWQQFAREAAGIIHWSSVRRRTPAAGSSRTSAAATASTAHQHAGCAPGGDARSGHSYCRSPEPDAREQS